MAEQNRKYHKRTTPINSRTKSHSQKQLRAYLNLRRLTKKLLEHNEAQRVEVLSKWNQVLQGAFELKREEKRKTD